MKKKILIAKKSTATFIEVCAGCGGLSSGLILAGFTPLLLNEIDPTCCQTLRENHPDVKIHCGSMVNLTLTGFQPDLLVGGVPCQSFSQAGQRKGLNDDRGQLIIEFKRLIDEAQPKVFAIENVKGLVTHEHGQTLTKILAHLSTPSLSTPTQLLSYRIVWKVLNAVDYRVPQKRERLFIVGVRSDITKKYVFPEIIPQKMTLHEVLSDVPASEGYVYPTKKQAILKLVPPGGCWVDLPLDLQREYMGGSFNSGGGKRGIARRLSLDEPSLTLTTSPMQKQTERCHPTETRPLTVREYARIQTFPDDYIFHGSIAQKYKQIGNAVPVNLAKAIGLSIKSLLK